MGKRKTVQDTANLHESTVQKAEALSTSQRKATNVTRVVVETHTIEGYNIPKAVMKVALELAGGDITRLKVNRDGSVLVVNQSRKVQIKR